MNSEAVKKAKRPVFGGSVTAKTTGEVSMVLPSDIRADHTRNDSRGGWAPYAAPDEIAELLNGPCGFTLAEIEQKLSSILLDGQISEIECYLDENGTPVVKIGYLRHCAMLLAEARGILASIPTTARTAVWGVRVKIVPRPKTQNDWDAAADRNYAENAEHLPPTPVQFAFYCKNKLAAFDSDGQALYPTRKALAQKLSASGRRTVSERMIAQHLQLLKAHPSTLLAVHEGRMKMADALRQMKENGEVATRRSRASQRPAKPLAPAIIIRAIEHSDKRPPPSKGLSAQDMLLCDRLVCGLDVVTDETPAIVREWFAWKAITSDEAKALAPEKPPRDKTARKKAPLKPGASV